MAKRSRGLGLSAYFGYTAWDINVARIPEGRGRSYLEHRLAQVELWIGYLNGRVRDHRRLAGGRIGPTMRSPETAREEMDLAYLHDLRRTLRDTLKIS